MVDISVSIEVVKIRYSKLEELKSSTVRHYLPIRKPKS